MKRGTPAKSTVTDSSRAASTRASVLFLKIVRWPYSEDQSTKNQPLRSEWPSRALPLAICDESPNDECQPHDGQREYDQPSPFHDALLVELSCAVLRLIVLAWYKPRFCEWWRISLSPFQFHMRWRAYAVDGEAPS